MPKPEIPRGLCAILDASRVPPARMPAVARAMAEAGAPWLQLRWKRAPGNELYEVAVAVRRALEGLPVLFLLNDRVDIAKMAGADGVHLGQEDMPPLAARKVLGEGAVIGLSTHNVDDVWASRDEPVDYIGFGPIYTTPSKPDAAPVVGIDGLREAVIEAAVPVVAIGGIDAGRAPAALGAGARAVAMIGAVCGNKGGADAAALVAEVLAAIGGAAP